MTLAFFSDIHANLPALEAVLEDIDRRRPDMVFCLGDLVGYAPWPNEVIEMIRERGIPAIAGNYDDGVGRKSDDCGCAYKTDEDKERGARSIAFTNDAVTPESRAYLRGLPRQLRLEFADGQTFLMVHGSPRKINEYLFEDRPDKSFSRMMSNADADVMLFGHTHKPFHKRLSGARHAVNIGSVGKPKDGDPRACYVLVHLEPDEPRDVNVQFVRVEYDVEKVVEGILSSPLPGEFAEQLRAAR